MISLDKCNQILNKGEKKYSNEQIKLVRETLYSMTEIINLKHYENEANINREKRHSIQKGKH
jgi:hypothetical protein